VMHRDGWGFPGQHAMKPISMRQLYQPQVIAVARGFPSSGAFVPLPARNASRQRTVRFRDRPNPWLAFGKRPSKRPFRAR
jgi:hypothetical protein